LIQVKLTLGTADRPSAELLEKRTTDQGLDQEFNSLDAQYDASSAYIKSQAHAG
jgi:hypothetical protein